MNEIEKLYELAGCKKILCDCTNCKKTDCTGNVDQDTCVKLAYPPFTAEKQVELIKWISHHDGCFKVYLNSIEFGDTGFGSCFTFEESLAKAVSNFLMSATDKEKEKVREILE